MRIAIVIGQVLITALLFWFVAQRFDLATAIGHLTELAPGTLVAVVTLSLIQVLIASYRLRFSLRVLGGDCTFRIAMDAVFAGNFFSQTPLSNVGCEMARVWILSSGDVSLRRAASSVTLDRVFGFLGLVIIMLLGLPALWSRVSDPALLWGILSVLALAGIALLILLALQKMPAALRRLKLIDWIGQVSKEFHDILRRKTTVALILGFSVTAHFGSLVVLYILARDVGAEITLLQVCYLAPFPLLASLLPISIGGWGVRESAMVIAFGLVGVPEAKSFSVSFLFGLLSLTMALPGGIIWLRAHTSFRRL